jgi:hypothetical protein
MNHPQNNILEYLINYHSYDKMQLNVCSQVSVNKLIGITPTIWVNILEGIFLKYLCKIIKK